MTSGQPRPDGSERPEYPYAHEPWAPYYLYQNPGWDRPRDGYVRWKLATSRKATAVDTWQLREQARRKHAAVHGPDPEGWPDQHPTVVVYPTNAPEAVCLQCLWIDGSYWENRGAAAAGRLHTLETLLADREASAEPGQHNRTVQP